MFDLVGGLPIHPLVVHAAVVLLPLSALGVLLYAFVPRWRLTLRWPLLVVGTLGAAAVPAAYFTGEPFRDRLGLAESNAVQRHADFAQPTLVIAFVWWVVLVALLARAPGGSTSGGGAWPPRWLLAIAVLVSLAGIAAVVVTGHSGASSVWAPRVSR